MTTLSKQGLNSYYKQGLNHYFTIFGVNKYELITNIAEAQKCSKLVAMYKLIAAFN